MIDKNDKIALRQILMEHYTDPDHKAPVTPMPNSFIKYQDSPTCSDEINVQITYENQKVTKAIFDGVTCSISGAAIDILCDQITNQSKAEALKILSNYHNMIVGEVYDETTLGELIAFHNIYSQRNRINCALLGADGLRYILEEEVK
ncbi:FeS assembly protein [Spiroplasma clarkii]|uniref:FeS assembly protein n=1 Tax=Spiroplasma clarkii TaxID=2139 RepID=A0A1Y0KZV9_9MOLU|nr:iron-sulfur cluster assembly scaffold protein [Spiroplasma clarkii]ARU91276.1 FeS assembly protein [Spiroplasma clarkii]ATX70713.1 FeS assembly protein [Spiroplasma clarkii]